MTTVADAVIGQKSDHFRSRLGCRHPFMCAAYVIGGQVIAPAVLAH